MRYQVLGRTGMEVSVLGLGTMMLGGPDSVDEPTAVRIVNDALDEGINLVDTADVYNAGESERIVGKALAGRRDEVILATKCHHPLAGTTPGLPVPPNARGNSRRHIIRACEASLRRLGTDWIDLYQIHQPDATTELDETLGALSRLVDDGKVRVFGSSNFPADLIVEGQWAAQRSGHQRFRSEQFPYSIFVRRAERDILPVCVRHGIGTLAFSPLNGGWLSGAYRPGMPPRTDGQAGRIPARFDQQRPHVRRKLALVEELSVLAAEVDLTLADLATAWVLAHPAVTATIIGPRTHGHLVNALGAADLELPTEVLDRIDDLVPPGTAVHTEESRWKPPELRPQWRRRPASNPDGTVPLGLTTTVAG